MSPGCLAAQTPWRSLHKDVEATAPAKGLCHTGTTTPLKATSHTLVNHPARGPQHPIQILKPSEFWGETDAGHGSGDSFSAFHGVQRNRQQQHQPLQCPPSFHSRLLAGGQRNGVSPGPSRQVATPFTCCWRTCPRVGCGPGPLASVRCDSLGLRNDHLF